MAMLAMRVERQFPMKASTTMEARMAPSTRCSFTSPMELRMKTEPSLTTCTFTPGGRFRSMRPRRALRRSTTSTVLVPLCFCTTMETALSPS